MARARWIVLTLALVVLGAACGQKAGVGGEQSAQATGPGASVSAASDAGGAGVPSSEGTLTTTSSAATGGSSATAAPSRDGSGSVSSGAPTTGSGASPSAPVSAVPVGDRTGITDTVIKIGLHAPVTGAAPVPTEAFRTGLPIYWNFIWRTQHGVYGRQVQVVFRDDQFNPSTAVRVCREMVEQEHVFLLVGAAGADQITACAKYANSVGVPYISAGVNQDGLAGLRGYFAASQTYLQQNPMLAQLAKRKTKNNKFAIVVENSPTFAESKASIEAAAQAQGLDVVYDRYITKGASQAEILTTSAALRSSGADVVYFLGPPTTFIPLAQQGASQTYLPQYIGPGLSNGLNLVAQAGCPGVSGAEFLSPFPGLDVIDRLDPNYTQEYRSQTNQQPDDFGLALWGLNKGIHQYLLAAGKDLTRQSFVQTLERGKAFASNVYPEVRYDPSHHFGATTSHLLVADCTAHQFKTAATFVSGF